MKHKKNFTHLYEKYVVRKSGSFVFRSEFRLVTVADVAESLAERPNENDAHIRRSENKLLSLAWNVAHFTVHLL